MFFLSFSFRERGRGEVDGVKSSRMDAGPKITGEHKCLKGIDDKIGELVVMMMMMISRSAALCGGFVMHLIDHIYLAVLHPLKSLSYLRCEDYEDGNLGTKREP